VAATLRPTLAASCSSGVFLPRYLPHKDDRAMVAAALRPTLADTCCTRPRPAGVSAVAAALRPTLAASC